MRMPSSWHFVIRLSAKDSLTRFLVRHEWTFRRPAGRETARWPPSSQSCSRQGKSSYTERNRAESAANRFALAELAPIYTRIGNPTQDAVEQRIASLEGGLAALQRSSGQAAEPVAILNIAEAGDHVVASPSLYGGTYNLLAHTLKTSGISVTFVADPDNLDHWRDAVQPNTKLFFAEVVSNPRQDVLDIEGVSRAAHEAGVPLVVDNTLSAPYLIRPLEWGALWSTPPPSTSADMARPLPA
jgi:O-acetylhomoserine/O-acetylserine sulfhydrylase-like pyridoxal-dependent enzyme